VITYGFSPQADVRGVEINASIRGIGFEAVITDRKSGSVRTLGELFLPMFGQHNVLNALAAIAIAGELGIGDDVVRKALAGFAGVNRRFTKTGEVAGVTVIDDYAHHPVEIAAVLSAARSIAPGQVIAVVQPHRYSRLRDLFEGFCTCFNDADAVVVADVYPAGEPPLPGIDRDALVEGLRSHGHRRVVRLPDAAALADVVTGIANSGDLVVCLGAGSISQWAHALPGELEALRGQASGGGR
jgi:UDP-N-acetylmuramate--alanine ligase